MRETTVLICLAISVAAIAAAPTAATTAVAGIPMLIVMLAANRDS